MLHLKAVGKCDLSKDRAMRTDDIFWIASMTKPLVAVCIAILADEGKLAFDDPIAKHLPEFANLSVSQNGETTKPARQVTLRDVMTHTSGLGELTPREPHLTLAETSKALAQRPLRFQPGSRWAYSTAGIDILGRIVEVVGGTPLDQFLQKRVLDPLGMETQASGSIQRMTHAGRDRTGGTRKRANSKRQRSPTCTTLPRQIVSAPRSAAPGSSQPRRTLRSSIR